MATQKELLLDALQKGKRGRTELVEDIATKAGVQTINVRRRLNELVTEGRILQSVSASGVVTCVLSKQSITTDERVVLDQQMNVLKENNRDLKRQYKEALKYRQLGDALIDAYSEYGQRWQSVPIITPILKPDVVSYQTSVSLLSDWHFWEIVDKQETRGLADYDMDVATVYMQHLCDKTLHILHDINKGIEYKKHYVLMLGDFVSTNIHDILEHSPGTAVDSLLEAQLILGRYLMDLARHFDELHVYGVVGNHGRLTQRKRYKKRYANFDYVLYNQLAMMLSAQENITFSFPRSFFDLVEIESHIFLTLHGDDIRSWNQIPYYGIDRAVRKFRELLAANDESFDYVVLGHFHNTDTLEMCRGEKFINGSAIGMTDFSMGKLFTGNRPHQTIFSVHGENGVTWRNPIHLQVPENVRYTLNRSIQIHEQWKQILYGVTGVIDPNCFN